MKRLLWLPLGLVLAAPSPMERFLVDEIAAVDKRLDDLDKQQVSLLQQSDAFTAQKVAHEEDRARAEEGLAQHRADAGRRLGLLYRMRRRGLASILLQAETPAEFRRRFRYLATVVGEDRERAAQYQKALDGVHQADEKLEADLQALSTTRSDLEKTRADLNAQRRQRVALLSEIRGSPELTNTWTRQAAAAQSEYNPPPPPPRADPLDFRRLKGSLPSPIRGPIVRGFGSIPDSSGQSRQNLGVDYLVPLGSPFVAVADGLVTRVQYVRAYGMSVLVEHGAYLTLYAHAQAAKVAQGQTVKSGDILGLAGNTGLTDDSNGYLHFEVRYNGTAQNPLDWLSPGGVYCHPDAVLCR